MTAKIVYYGPGLCGKTTNLMVIFDKLDPKPKGEDAVAGHQNRSHALLRPPARRHRQGRQLQPQDPALHRPRPGLLQRDAQAGAQRRRRRRLRRRLAAVDGRLHPRELRQSPRQHEGEQHRPRTTRRSSSSTTNATSPASCRSKKLQEALGLEGYPYTEASAIKGEGVMETFKLVSKITAKHLYNRLKGKSEPIDRKKPGKGGQGREAENRQPAKKKRRRSTAPCPARARRQPVRRLDPGESAGGLREDGRGLARATAAGRTRAARHVVGQHRRSPSRSTTSKSSAPEELVDNPLSVALMDERIREA